jgi:hypothetical protein
VGNIRTNNAVEAEKVHLNRVEAEKRANIRHNRSSTTQNVLAPQMRAITTATQIAKRMGNSNPINKLGSRSIQYANRRRRTEMFSPRCLCSRGTRPSPLRGCLPRNVTLPRVELKDDPAMRATVRNPLVSPYFSGRRNFPARKRPAQQGQGCTEREFNHASALVCLPISSGASRHRNIARR